MCVTKVNKMSSGVVIHVNKEKIVKYCPHVIPPLVTHDSDIEMATASMSNNQFPS